MNGEFLCVSVHCWFHLASLVSSSFVCSEGNGALKGMRTMSAWSYLHVRRLYPLPSWTGHGPEKKRNRQWQTPQWALLEMAESIGIKDFHQVVIWFNAGIDCREKPQRHPLVCYGRNNGNYRLATNSFGQGFAWPWQMAAAFSSGQRRWPEPHGKTSRMKAERSGSAIRAPQKAISSETSTTVSQAKALWLPNRTPRWRYDIGEENRYCRKTAYRVIESICPL